ncbi:helix-turn-helix transcriptional regulator [Cloacibacillus sp. An23]|uniref:helix-turn-helix domain-containing protein n=1 Tax=Cloacibacillus sp. An23 TaxID=1965591 RepID=UPI001302E720|nr:helix-turn-helix transcriptional regulator [Cloacibacillus sp. An23]
MSQSVVPGLRAAIKRAGYTQTSLAAELGIAISTVARWLSGQQEPSIATLKQLTVILNCSFAELIGEPEHNELNGCSIVEVKECGGEKLITLRVKI